MHFWTFWGFSAWKWAKLALIYSKRHLQHDSMPFFPLASCFFFPQACVEISRFSFSYLFASVTECLQRLLPVQEFLRKHHYDRKLLPQGRKWSHRIFCCELFTRISQHFYAYLRLHWTHQWKLKIFSSCRTWVPVDDTNFGQRWWHQKWNKGQHSSQLVVAGIGAIGCNLLLSRLNSDQGNCISLLFYISLE